MPFQMPVSIAEVLRDVQRRNLALPAIQREFVWDSDQVARLFDSILRGYPIGSFLSWSVDGDHSGDYKFYGFIKDYHELLAPHCPVLDVEAGRGLVAVLDGQQRITALNIGLRGSLATRLRGRWWNKPENYPVKHLFLNILTDAPENELGMKYDFRFFSQPPESTREGHLPPSHWFPVHLIYETEEAIDFHAYLVDRGLGDAKGALRLLSRLHKSIHDDKTIYFYEETDQDLDKVLDIFIRVNSGGTVLSYSDLLLSIATAQWTELDARDEIHSLVAELNDIGQGFALTKDIVLKAGLVLTDVSDIGFKVTNFNQQNMAQLEKDWLGIESALRLTVGLLADFGFNASTLSANSVVIPVAYYIHQRTLTDDYRIQAKYREDRASIRHWVTRTLIKPGIWGSGLDTVLRDLREVLREHGAEHFPVTQIEARMGQRGKSIAFTPEEIGSLAETDFASKRVFALLATLFPNVDTRHLFHIDHVYPRARFSKRRLREAGVEESAFEDYQALMNKLPNLQLLEGTTNMEKQDKFPLSWASGSYGSGLADYLSRQTLEGLTDDIAAFPEFYAGRRQRLARRLALALGVNPEDLELPDGE
jgi:hypothetical protein